VSAEYSFASHQDGLATSQQPGVKEEATFGWLRPLPSAAFDAK
jgi:hypothetical protein